MAAAVYFENSFFDDEVYVYVSFGSFIVLFFSWCFFAHFLNIIRRNTENPTIARMFWLLMFTTIYTLLLVAVYYAYVNDMLTDTYDDWNDFLESLDVSEEIIVIAATLLLYFSYKECVISMMGYIICDACGCTNPADQTTREQQTRFVA